MKVEVCEVCGEKFYLDFINHFIQLYAPPAGFDCFFIAVSPPLDIPKYFYNFTYRDSLRNCFKRVFNASRPNHYDFLRAFTSAGCILIDLVYYPTCQQDLNRILIGDYS